MGGIYSYFDARDRFTIAAGGTHIWTLVEGGSAESPAFELPTENDVDLSELIHPEVDGNLAGLMLDWQGRIWFATTGKEDGKPARVYVLNPATATYPYTDTKSVPLDQGEIIRNTFALDKTGRDRSAAYFVSSQKMYRIDAGPDDQPHIVWSQPYDTVPSDTNNEQYVNGVKNGQYELGSGTSPTILGEGRYVAITDNAEQMKVVVNRTDAKQAEMVNGETVNIPSYLVKGGDVIALREKAKKQLRVVDAVKLAESVGMPGWVQVDASKFEGVFKKVPDRDEFGSEINESLIVELYSR